MYARGEAEPFFPPRPYSTLQTEQTVKISAAGLFASALSTDLVSAMARQSTFLHSLLRPCYLERPFLEAAVIRYKRFLLLHKEHPGMVLVPMMDIDLIWHAHMGSGGDVYQRDTKEAFNGKVFSHDDHAAPSVLGKAFEATKVLYEQRFGEIYNPPPTMVSCSFVIVALAFEFSPSLGLNYLPWINRTP